MAGPFVVATGELSRHPGTRRRVTRTGRLRGVGLSTSRLTDDDVVVDVTLEGQGTTLTATGTVTGRWSGECRRCLEATGGDLVVELHEVFTPDPVEGETYELGRDHVDLEPAVREAVALALPLAPLCDEACAGPDPEGHPVVADADDADDADDAGHADDDAGDDGEPVDHRWAALDALRFDA